MICVTLVLTIPTIVIAVRSSMATTALELRVSALEMTINTLGATQKAQMSKMTKIVSDIQNNMREE
jgi:chaperonin cofactor prefoldin